MMKYEIAGVASFIYLFWYFGIWYCIVRYRFLSLTPELVSKDLINNVDVSFILLDYNQSIISANDKAKSLLNCSKIENCGIKNYLHKCDDLNGEIDKMLKGELNDFTVRTNFLNSDNEKIMIDARCSVVKDKHDDILGIMLIGSEVKGIKELQSHFKITDREAEVIQKIVIGHNNAQIAESLGITENTIKRHITNIYNKLIVNNKLELINLLREFELIPQHSADKPLLLY
ncbi:LuxR C-terminal-related transcriptional regulator [Spirochaetota bacterium]